jgi:hypothetical protein
LLELFWCHGGVPFQRDTLDCNIIIQPLQYQTRRSNRIAGP